MMLHKIHLKLTLLCTLITTVIMLIMSFIYLHVSEKQLFQNQLYSFQNDLHTMETNMEQQSIISMAWISKMEAYGNYQLYLIDQGTPFLYNQLHSSTESNHLLESAMEDLTHATLTDAEIQSLVLSSSQKEDYLTGVIYRDEKNSSFQLFVFSSLAHFHLQVMQQRILFLFITLFMVLLLFSFSWFFTAKLLKPIQENQEKQLHFVASASHELRTPLAVILSSAECCALDANENQRSFLDTIQTEGSRMAHLIEEMLYLSQSNQKKNYIRLQQVELDTLCMKVFESFEPLAKKEGLSLSLQLPSEAVPPITCDEEKISQVLGILLSNAMNYTPSEGCITLGLKRNGKIQELFVSDTGIGIPTEERALIFDRFYRAEKSRSTKGHFGLGLSIAYEIISAHGGTIAVQDNFPQGTVFTITL